MTEASKQMLENLRNTDNLQWYIVPFIVLIIYVYVSEIGKKKYSAVLLGIYSFSSGWILEIVNALVLHFTQRSALWTTPGRSSFVIYAGWNFEIFVLAALGGLIVIKSLPEDRNLKIFGISNRIVMPILWSIFAVAIEITLNFTGMLVWEYKFWSWPNIYFMVIWWSVPYFMLIRMHDKMSMKKKKIYAFTGPSLAIICHIVFATILKWV